MDSPLITIPIRIHPHVEDLLISLPSLIVLFGVVFYASFRAEERRKRTRTPQSNPSETPTND